MVRDEIGGEQLGDRLEPALAPNLLMVPQHDFLVRLPHADLHSQRCKRHATVAADGR